MSTDLGSRDSIDFPEHWVSQFPAEFPNKLETLGGIFPQNILLLLFDALKL